MIAQLKIHGEDIIVTDGVAESKKSFRIFLQ